MELQQSQLSVIQCHEYTATHRERNIDNKGQGGTEKETDSTFSHQFIQL